MRLEDLNPETQRSLLATASVAAPVRKAKASKEALFAFHVRAYRLPTVETQHRFALAVERQWRFDFAWPQYRVAVEIEGLVMRKLAGQLVVMGRHASPQGIKDDMEKYNTAVLLGWNVLRFEQGMVKSGAAIAFTQRVLHAKGWNPGGAM